MSTIYVGTTSPPSPGLGVDTDIYVNTVTGDFFQKSGTWMLQGNIRGPQGLLGPQGPQGVRGSITFTQPGPPNPLIGVNNDTWLNATTGDLYTMINNAWVIQGNIQGPRGFTGPSGPGIVGPIGPQGPQGNRGTNITAEEFAPTVSNPGMLGDVWLNATTGDIYQYEVSGWEIEGNIRGIQGITGPVGPQGPPGPAGPSGFPEIASLETSIDVLYPSNYKQVTYNIEDQVTDIDVWDSPAKTVHVFNKHVTYTGGQVTRVLTTRVASGGSLQKDITYIAGVVTSINVTFIP